MRLEVVFLFFGFLNLALAGENAALRELKNPTGEDDSNEVRALKTELLVKQTEMRAMVQLNKLLKQARGTALEPELLFRKAELFMRQSKSNRFFELNKKNEKIGRLMPPVAQKASEKKSIQEAINIYDRMIRQFPNYAKMDMVLFNDGFANQLLTHFDRARSLFKKLIIAFPNSVVIPDAYLSIGEMYFQESQFDKALQYFNDLQKYPDSRVYPYGLYKTAWTYYNLHDAKSGLRELERLVEFGEKVEQEGLDSRLDLRKEALEDMALFFEDVYPAAKAYNYFKKPAGKLGVAAVLLRLGELYKSHSRYKDLAIVLQDLIANSPHSVYVPTAYVELINNYETLKDRGKAVGELEKFHSLCAPDGEWIQAQSAGRLEDTTSGFSISAETNCREAFDETSLKLATKWHRMWRKQPQFKELAIAAETAYRLFLDGTQSKNNLNQMRFNFAELLFQNQKYREASQNYALVARHELADEQLRHDAGYGAVVALEKDVGEKPWSDSDTLLFKELANLYFQNSPKGKYISHLKYKIGFIAYSQNRFDEAINYFSEIGRLPENIDLAHKAQDLLMDIYNKQRQYTELKKYAKDLVAKESSLDRQDKLTKIYRQSYFAEIQVLEEGGKIEKAIDEYLTFSRQNKESDLGVKAWWNAIQLYFKIGKLYEAASQGYEYVRNYPKDPNAKNLLLRSAQAFEKIGRVQEAANILLHLAKKDSKEQKKWELMAANLLAVSDNKDLARKYYEKYATDKGGYDPEVLSRWYVMEKALGIKNYVHKVQTLIFRFRFQPLLGEIILSQLEEEMAHRNYKKAFELSKKLVGMTSKGLESVRAFARFYQAQILEEEFRNQSLKASAERLAIVIELKTKRLEKVQRAYEDVVKMGQAKVGLMALQRLGESYLHYAQAIRGIEIPTGTPDSEAKAFRAQLEELAAPVEQKGLMTLSSALAQAVEAGLTDTTVEQLRQSLHRAQNVQRPHFEIQLSLPALVLPHLREGTT